MNDVTSKKFEFEGDEYEVRVVRTIDGYEVAAFLNGKRANGYTYSVNLITNFDYSNKFGEPAYLHLMETAESDVRAKFWERFIKANTANN